MRTKMSEVLIPMLLYPLLSPIIISAVNITQAMINELEYVNYSFWIMIIFTFSILFTLIGYLTFDIVSEE
jgi:heme exporter protein B